MDEDELLQLLRELDLPLASSPKGFDFEMACARVEQARLALEQLVPFPCPIYEGPTFSYRSYHAAVCLPRDFVRNNGWAAIRFSNFGAMVGCYDEHDLDEAIREAVKGAVEHHGYCYLPIDILLKPYDGDAFETWWNRYFDHFPFDEDKSRRSPY